MTFCKNCGFKTSDDAVYCAGCGAQLTAPVKKTEKEAPVYTRKVSSVPLLGGLLMAAALLIYRMTQRSNINELVINFVVNYIIYFFVCLLIAMVYRGYKGSPNNERRVVLALPLATLVCSVLYSAPSFLGAFSRLAGNL
jgi:uncharacterized membrane protein YvbJ